MYLASSDTEYTWADYTYSTADNKWTFVEKDGSVSSIREDSRYYIYGYMPNDVASSVTLLPPEGGFSKGADLTLNGLPTISDKDICVVVGVRRAESTTATASATEGNYAFFSGVADENKQTYVNLLMDHVYSQLQLSFNVDADYAELRTIHLKEVTLNTTFAGTVSYTVKLRDGKGIDEIVKGSTSGSALEKKILDPATDTEQVLTTTPQTLGRTMYCAPSILSTDGTTLTVKSAYDVYDRKGNLVRKDCTAENKIRLGEIDMGHGVKRTLLLTVVPTYLYILSDGDLDNPTIKVN